MELKKYVDDRHDKGWENEETWFRLVALNMDWLDGKIGGTHPVSNEVLEKMDTDEEWTDFLKDVTRGFACITTGSQTGVCGGGTQERPYVSILVEATMAEGIMGIVRRNRTRMDIVTLFCSDNSYEIITPGSLASRTRNGAKYNDIDTSCMETVNGRYTFVLTMEDGIPTTHLPHAEWVGQNIRREMSTFIGLDRDPTEFVEITFAAIKYGDRQDFMRSVRSIISYQVD